MRVIILRCFMRFSVNRSVVRVTGNHERIDIRIEMKMPNHRWQNLKHVGPTTCTISSRSNLRWLSEHRIN